MASPMGFVVEVASSKVITSSALVRVDILLKPADLVAEVGRATHPTSKVVNQTGEGC
jgi:hypothetical protein